MSAGLSQQWTGEVAEMGGRNIDNDHWPSLTEADFARVDAETTAMRYDPVPPKGDQLAAFDDLHKRLIANAQLYEGDMQDQRDAVADTMVSIKDYLNSQGVSLPALEPLMRPVLALVERESNRIDPLFGERARQGRPKRSMIDHNRNGAIAAIAEYWLSYMAKEDRPQDQKLRMLARDLSGGWFGNMSTAKIKAARETVSQEAKDHLSVRWAIYYREQLDAAAAIFGDRQAIQIVKRNLNRSKPTF